MTEYLRLGCNHDLLSDEKTNEYLYICSACGRIPLRTYGEGAEEWGGPMEREIRGGGVKEHALRTYGERAKEGSGQSPRPPHQRREDQGRGGSYGDGGIGGACGPPTPHPADLT